MQSVSTESEEKNGLINLKIPDDIGASSFQSKLKVSHGNFLIEHDFLIKILVEQVPPSQTTIQESDSKSSITSKITLPVFERKEILIIISFGLSVFVISYFLKKRKKSKSVERESVKSLLTDIKEGIGEK